MQVISTLLSQITLLQVLIYFAVGFAFWYVYYGLETYLNGGSTRGKWWVFKCFWEEILWFSPGGLARRTEYIRKLVHPEGDNFGYICNYTYAEIRRRNLYEKVAKKSLGSGFYFWGVNVILIFFLWPLVWIAFVLIIAVGSVMSLLGIQNN